MGHDMHVWRSEDTFVRFLLLLSCGFQGLDSGCPAWVSIFMCWAISLFEIASLFKALICLFYVVAYLIMRIPRIEFRLPSLGKHFRVLSHLTVWGCFLFFKRLWFVYLMWMCICLLLSLHSAYASPVETRRGNQIPGTGPTGGSQLVCGY